MKLRTKLIPLFTAASAAAVIAPLTLTSCGDWIRYTDLLHKRYDSWVRPHDEVTVLGGQAITRLYTNDTMQNTNILRDDILWSNSTLLNIEEPHSAINEIIKYKEFNLDVFFSKKKVFDAYESYDAYCAEFESHVVGQVINESQVDPANEYLVDDGKAIDEFDFYFDVTIYGLTNISVEAISPSLLSDLPNMNIITVKFNDSSTIVDTTVSGRYTLKGTNEEKTIENKREILNDASKDKIKNTLYSWFGATTLALLTFATNGGEYSKQQNASDSYGAPEFSFISHYLKNVKYTQNTNQK